MKNFFIIITLWPVTLGDFLGHSANAVRWQVWSALLVSVLPRFLSQMGEWAHSFPRLYAVVRGALWEKVDLMDLLRNFYGRRRWVLSTPGAGRTGVFPWILGRGGQGMGQHMSQL